MHAENKLPSLVNTDFIQIRDYQIQLYLDAFKRSSIVVLPTGLGKTTVAALVIARKLEENMESQALVLAPTKPLVKQHAEFFAKALLLDRWQLGALTGAEPPAQRSALWGKCKLLVATPQVVRNDLVTNRYGLASVSVVVFDEVHRAVGNYPYTFIARKYLAQNPGGLMLGLTASPTTAGATIPHLSDVLGNAAVLSRTQEDRDVRGYVGKIEHKLVMVEPPSEFSSALNFLRLLLQKFVQPLYEKKLIGRFSPKTVPLRVLIDVQKTVAQKAAQNGWDETLSETVMQASNAVRVEHALNLFETQGVSAALLYMLRIDEQSRRKSTKSLRALTTDPYWVISKAHLDNLQRKGVEHPKLAKLCEILSDYFSSSKGKAIVFTNYRDTSSLIAKTLERVPGIRPVRFVGQATKGSDKGLSQKEQEALLDEFRHGSHNVLVATQVAEEGLDIDECNLVVMYDSVPSSVRLVQRTGRTGRKTDGTVVHLVTKGTRDEAYYWIAKRKRDAMQAEIKSFSPVQRPALPALEPLKESRVEQATGGEAKAHSATLSDASDSDSAEQSEIIADTRESSSTVLEHLSNLGVRVKLEQLGVADYVLSDQVCVERKSTQDFASSILDGRLFEQALNMRRTYRKPVMVVEGETLYTSSLNPEAVRGAMISLAIDYGVPILWSRSPSETAR
ncbi:MAG: ERCC4 domain-containing protein, partial [Thermoprotei archaeon]